MSGKQNMMAFVNQALDEQQKQRAKRKEPKKSKGYKSVRELIRANSLAPLNPGTTEPVAVTAKYRNDHCSNCRGQNMVLVSLTVTRQNIRGPKHPYSEPITLSTLQTIYPDLPFHVRTYDHWTPLCYNCAMERNKEHDNDH